MQYPFPAWQLPNSLVKVILWTDMNNFLDCAFPSAVPQPLQRLARLPQNPPQSQLLFLV